MAFNFNPSLSLENSLAGYLDDEPVLIDALLGSSMKAPRFINPKTEYLRYIRHQQFAGKYSFATIQEFDDVDEATRHWDTQKEHDEKVFIHPSYCETHQGKYVLVFPKVIRLFKVWVEEHIKNQVKETDMWEALKKIGGNLMYLVEADRPHGNLEEGIGVTSDLQPFFLNFGADVGAPVYERDAKALLKILTDVEPMFQNRVIKDYVTKWKSFLSASCSGNSPADLPHYSPDHVRLVFSYPFSWDHENKLRFIANIYKLCREKSHNTMNLKHEPYFAKHLGRHYSNWASKLTNDAIALKEVYDFGLTINLYKKYDSASKRKVLCEASIVIFANNCIQHHCETAENYNKAYGTHLRDLISSQILTQLCSKFPNLVENIYEAFYMALAFGVYSHPTFSVAQILTGTI